MARITVRHEADRRFAVTIRRHRLVVDQPEDAGGGDAGPTPTELFVASVAGCAAYYASRFLARHGVADGELAAECAYATSADAPWRVTRISVRLALPRALDAEVRDGALRAAEHCLVHNSLRQPPAIDLSLEVAEPVPS